MATHSSVLAWRIPGTGEPGGLPSMGRTELNTTEVTQQQQQGPGDRGNKEILVKENKVSLMQDEKVQKIQCMMTIVNNIGLYT